MQALVNTPGGQTRAGQDIVEIKLWEVYLTYSHRNLYRTLAAYSIDNGPVEKDHQEEGRICFRFLAFDWDRAVKQLLYDNRIPVVIRSNPLSAVRMRGYSTRADT